MKPIEVQHKLTYWQSVFLQSKANGASYNGESLPGRFGVGRRTLTSSANWSASNRGTRTFRTLHKRFYSSERIGNRSFDAV